MPFLQQVSGVLHAAVSVMQKAIGIMVLAALGWADDAAYLDLKAYRRSLSSWLFLPARSNRANLGIWRPIQEKPLGSAIISSLEAHAN